MMKRHKNKIWTSLAAILNYMNFPFYFAGNSYGCDVNECGVGLGKQEQFINCADIAILQDCSNFTLQATPPVANSQYTHSGHTSTWDKSYHSHRQMTNHQHGQWTTQRNNQWTENQHGQWADQQHGQWTTHENNQWTDDDEDDDLEEPNTFTDDQTTIWRPAGLATKSAPFRAGEHGCYATGMFADIPNMSYWCDINCNAKVPFCPKSHCRCGDDTDELYKVYYSHVASFCVFILFLFFNVKNLQLKFNKGELLFFLFSTIRINFRL